MPETSTTPAPFASAGEIEALRFRIDGLGESQRRFSAALESSDRIGRQFGRTLTNAFIGLAVEGKSFGAVLNTLVMSLSRIALRAAFKPLETAFGSALQSLISGPSLFSGASVAVPSDFPVAAGTPVSGDLISGSVVAGSVATPSSILAPAPSIVLNVTTPDADSFRRSETQIAALLARAVGQGHRNL
jgi:hypothetical protein